MWSWNLRKFCRYQPYLSFPPLLFPHDKRVMQNIKFLHGWAGYQGFLSAESTKIACALLCRTTTGLSEGKDQTSQETSSTRIFPEGSTCITIPAIAAPAHFLLICSHSASRLCLQTTLPSFTNLKAHSATSNPLLCKHHFHRLPKKPSH